MSSCSALLVKILREGGQVPKRGSAYAAGYDLYAAEDALIKAGGSGLVGTGISIAVPEGTYGRIASRSSLALNHSIHVGAGVIDLDYRGEVKVLLYNLSDKDFAVARGDRAAQLIIEKIATPDALVVDELPSSERSAGGFGSTGR